MEFEKIVPQWDAVGTEPPSSLKTSGFEAGYKPPAAYFNWFWNSVSQCLTELQTVLGGVNSGVAATSSDGVAYTATVDNVTVLKAGMSITVIPDMTATSTSMTLDVNGLGAKQVRRRLSAGTGTRATFVYANVFFKQFPIRLAYDGTYWVAVDFTKPCAIDLYGTVPFENGGLPEVTADDNGKFLRVASGAWSVAAIDNAEEASF
jgi:hypothetical protein